MRLTRYLMMRAARHDADPAWAVLTLMLVDDGSMRAVNGRCFGLDEPTDVISLTYAAVPGTEKESGREGEIVVNVERAGAVAGARPGWKVSDELALYVAHGCDHLSGADDSGPDERRRMRRRELRWLADARRSGLLDGLAREVCHGKT